MEGTACLPIRDPHRESGAALGLVTSHAEEVAITSEVVDTHAQAAREC